MAKVAYTNPTGGYQHVGNKTIPPFETREIEETDHPNYQAPDKKPEQPRRPPLLSLLDNSVKDIVAEFPNLSDDELAALEEAEGNDKPRTTLMAAFKAERLQRADTHLGQDMDAWVESLQAMNDDELTEQLDAFKDDDGRLALIQEEIDRRAKDGEK